MAPVCAPCFPDPTARLTSGAGNAEVAEEDIAHQLVVVLTGVHDDMVDATGHRRRDRGELDELGTGADDAQDTHGRLRAFR